MFLLHNRPFCTHFPPFILSFTAKTYESDGNPHSSVHPKSHLWVAEFRNSGQIPLYNRHDALSKFLKVHDLPYRRLKGWARAIPTGVCNILFTSFVRLHEKCRLTPSKRLSVQEKAPMKHFRKEKGISNKAVPTFFFIFAHKTGLQNLKASTATPIALPHDCTYCPAILWNSHNNRPPAHPIYL